MFYIILILLYILKCLKNLFSNCFLLIYTDNCSVVSRTLDYSLCPTLCPSWTTASVHGINHSRTLEWVAFPFSRGSSQLRDATWVSHIAGRFFTAWARKLIYRNLINFYWYSILLLFYNFLLLFTEFLIFSFYSFLNWQLRPLILYLYSFLI